MYSSSAAVLAALLVVAVVALLCGCYPSICRARRFMKDLARPGYLPDPPSRKACLWQSRLCRLLVFVFVGKLKIKGEENLDLVPEGFPCQVTPNHSHPIDVALLPLVMAHRKARYMADVGVMKGFFGLLGLLAAWMGAFAASSKAALKVLLSGQRMVLFPEGWTYLDGKMGVCRRGAVHLCRESAQSLGVPSYVIPVYVRYGRYPGAWIMRLPIRVQYLLLFLAFPWFRAGAEVVIGKPLSNADFSGRDREASEFLRQEIMKLDPQARS